jgi:hypothetical protein
MAVPVDSNPVPEVWRHRIHKLHRQLAKIEGKLNEAHEGDQKRALNARAVKIRERLTQLES